MSGAINFKQFIEGMIACACSYTFYIYIVLRLTLNFTLRAFFVFYLKARLHPEFS